MNDVKIIVKLRNDQNGSNDEIKKINKNLLIAFSIYFSISGSIFFSFSILGGGCLGATGNGTSSILSSTLY